MILVKQLVACQEQLISSVSVSNRIWVTEYVSYYLLVLVSYHKKVLDSVRSANTKYILVQLNSDNAIILRFFRANFIDHSLSLTLSLSLLLFIFVIFLIRQLPKGFSFLNLTLFTPLCLFFFILEICRWSPFQVEICLLVLMLLLAVVCECQISLCFQMFSVRSFIFVPRYGSFLLDT